MCSKRAPHDWCAHPLRAAVTASCCSLNGVLQTTVLLPAAAAARQACPFSHPGEKAHRRDPRAHSADMCKAMEQYGECASGDACPYAHTVFEVGGCGRL